MNEDSGSNFTLDVGRRSGERDLRVDFFVGVAVIKGNVLPSSDLEEPFFVGSCKRDSEKLSYGFYTTMYDIP